MKIVVQDIETQKYLAPGGNWTENISAAKDFQSRPRAFDALRLEHGRGLRVLYYFENLDYSIGVRNWTDQGWADVCAAG
jgi:hypothetical protein